MSWRIRLLVFMALLAAIQFTSVRTGETLAAIVFDGSKWSIPAEISVAVEELRGEGYEIRQVDWDVTNGDDGDVDELADCVAAGKQYGVASLTFRTGRRVSAGPVPLDGKEFKQAVK